MTLTGPELTDIEDLIIHLNLQGIDAKLTANDIDLIIEALEQLKENNIG